jgi:hypothetical protein
VIGWVAEKMSSNTDRSYFADFTHRQSHLSCCAAPFHSFPLLPWAFVSLATAFQPAHSLFHSLFFLPVNTLLFVDLRHVLLVFLALLQLSSIIFFVWFCFFVGVLCCD